jgi:hypothetical protein
VDECQVLRSLFGESSSGSKRADGHFNSGVNLAQSAAKNKQIIEEYLAG